MEPLTTGPTPHHSRSRAISPQSAREAPPPNPHARTNRILYVGLVLVVVAIVVLAVVLSRWYPSSGSGGSSSNQQYNYLNQTTWKFQGPSACWQGSPFSYGGTVPVNATFEASVSLPYPGGTTGPSCTAESVAVLTKGFELRNSNAPVTVSAGGTGRLFANVTTPGIPYTGELEMEVTVVSP